MSDASSYHVTRTLRTLELLSQRPRTAPDVAEALQVHPRTARRLLSQLVADGYVEQAGYRGEYALTLKIVALAGPVVDRTDLVRVAFPYVVRLRNETGETSHFGVPREGGVMHLAQESGESIVSVTSRLGDVRPYHSTAIGKAVLANSPQMWKPVIEAGLARYTERTIVDPADLLLELNATRERGYSVDDGENDLELRCCAAPVFGQGGEVVAALGMSAPASRLERDRLPAVGAIVAGVAQQLSGALGHVAAGAPARGH